MPYINPDIIIEARQMDLLTYLRNYEPHELVKFSGNTYTTRTHDSLKISNGKWMWWSRGIGGRNALDYLIKVKGLGFLEAVETIVGHTAVQAPIYEKPQPENKNKPLLLPDKCASNKVITEYLFGRGIDFEIINYCISNDLIFESLPYHNVVFVGYDEKKEPKYAAYRSTNKRRIMGDCSGSKKDYSFRLGKENLEEVHLFECAIDLLSYATLAKLNGQDWKEMSFVSLSGVYSPAKKIEDSKVPIALEKYLGSNPSVRKIRIHFDNDIAGRKAAQTLKTILPDKYEIVDEPPVEPEKYPKEIVIDDSLEAMQEVVGGDIEEYMPYDDDVAIICNEEGKMRGLPLNRAVYVQDNDKKEMVDIICGKFFICYAPPESESFQSLPDEYKEQFKYPERFSKEVGGNIVADDFLCMRMGIYNKKIHERNEER